VVISPSLRNSLGHYQDYAVRLLDAAQALGLDARLATHLQHGPGDDRSGPFFRNSCEFTQQGGAARGFGPDRLLRRLAKPRGAPVPAVAPAAATTDASPPRTPPRRGKARLAPILSRWRRLADHRADRLAVAEFQADLDRLLDTLDPRSGDIAFLADAGASEVRALAGRVAAGPASRLSWAVMLRRDVEPAGGSRWNATQWADALRDLAAAGGRVRLYADTEELARLYAEISGQPVARLPIPVTPARRLPRGPAFKVVYLGDARDEKGFAQLADAIGALENERRAGRMTFTLQSHFNSATGDARTAQARADLQALGAGVELIETVLDGEPYRRLLGQADAVVLPYDAEAYRRRSSGVLVEAISSGAPVVASAGSWMAAELQPYEQAHLRQATRDARAVPVTADTVPLADVAPGQTLVVALTPPADRAALTLTVSGADGDRMLVQWREAAERLLVAVPLRAGDRAVRLGGDGGFGLETAFMIEAGTPRGAVGLIVDRAPESIAEALRELAEHPAHYEAAAAAASVVWAHRHTALALVSQVVAEAAEPLPDGRSDTRPSAG
jgi:hypothetical protein